MFNEIKSNVFAKIFYAGLIIGIVGSAFLLTSVSKDFVLPLIVLATYAIAGYKKPLLSFQVLIAHILLSTILTSNFSAENILLAEFGLLGLSISLGYNAFCKLQRIKFCKADYFAGTFFLFSGIAFIAGNYLNGEINAYSARLLVLCFEFFLAYLIARSLPSSKEFVEKTIQLALGSALALAVFGIALFNVRATPDILVFFGLQKENFMRLSFPFFYENSAGMFFAIFFAISAVFAIFSKKTGRKFYAISIGILLLALLYTYSRGSWAIAIIGLLLIIATKIIETGKTKLKHFLLMDFGLIAIFLGLLLFALFFANNSQLHENPNQYSFIERVLDSKESQNVRQEIINLSVKGSMGKPFFGNGIGSFEKIYLSVGGQKYSGPENSHNTFLQYFLERGIIAGIAIILFQLVLIFYLIKFVKQKNNNIEKFLLVFFLLFFIGGLIEFSFYSTRIALLFWIIAGLSVGLVKSNKIENEKIGGFNIKKQILVIAFFCVIFLAFALPPFAMEQFELSKANRFGIIAEKRIENADFEQGLNGWAPNYDSKISIIENFAFSGKKSAKIKVEPNDALYSGLTLLPKRKIEIEADKNYYFSAMVFIPKNSPFGGTFAVDVQVSGESGCNGNSSCYKYKTIDADSKIDLTTKNGEWVKKFIKFKTTSEARYFVPYIISATNGAFATLFVDSIEFKKID